jgi:hypothetical protein
MGAAGSIAFASIWRGPGNGNECMSGALSYALGPGAIEDMPSNQPRGCNKMNQNPNQSPDRNPGQQQQGGQPGQKPGQQQQQQPPQNRPGQGGQQSQNR